MRAVSIIILWGAADILCLAQENSSHKNELAFGLGGFPSFTQSDVPKVDLGAGLAAQINYGRRFLNGELFALYGEINFLTTPTAPRNVTSDIPTATHDIASLYITPGIRLKLLPRSPISPWFALGGGYADYEQSTTTLNGQPNPAPRQLSRGVFDFGAGIDVHVWRWVALRGEARDFYSGAPNFNVPSVTGGQHNLVAGAALVLRWH